MSLRQRLVLVLGVALAAAPVAAAGTIEITTGDTVDILGSKIACLVVPAGKGKAVNCYLTTRKGVVPGTYGIALTDAGLASLIKVNTSGSGSTIVWKRKSASARAQGKYYTAEGGDAFVVSIKGGYLGCRVMDSTTGDKKFLGRKVSCWRSTALKAFPLTYGVTISDTYAASFHFDAKRNQSGPLFTRFQPK